MNATLASEISRLTPAEKFQLVEELWDDLAASEDQLPIPAWHQRILAEDAAQYQAKPNEGATWPEVKSRLPRKP